LGYTGGVVRLPHPHAFTINGRAYHQRGLDEEVIDLIEQELAAVNPFVQTRLIIQQSTNNTEIAACTIVHSTARVQERCVQIWHVGKEKPDYINILNENYETLQYPLFFPHSEIVDMFSRADDECLHFICQEQYQFRRGGPEEDKTLNDEMELYPNNIYLPASHTLSYRWSYKKTMDALAVVSKLGQPTLFITFTMNPNWPEIQQQLRTGQNYADRPDIVQNHLCDLVKQYMLHQCTSRCIQRDGHCHWNYPKPIQELTVINEHGCVHYRHRTEKGKENETIDEIKDYLNARYISTMEAVWQIFKYRITLQSPSVTCLPVHLPGEQIILQGNSNNNLSILQHYFLRPPYVEFNNLTYCKYYELYSFKYAEDSIDQKSLPPNAYLEIKQEGYHQREKYYLQMLLNYHAVQLFEDLRIVNSVLCSTFQDAARALGLLEDITEHEQCFAEAILYKCTPAQLRLLFCHLILEGMAAQSVWQNYHELLLADFIIKRSDIQQRENETLIWIANFIEEHGSRITQFGLPQLTDHFDEITCIKT
ncbi:5408_t:CDS:2, partial [Cetraspora pellucida]